MTTGAPLATRVLRRETHSPRSALAILLAMLAILALAWVVTEAVLAALGRPPLLLAPAAMATGIRGLPSVPADQLTAAGAVLVVVGVALVLVAVLPGRRGRHVLDVDGSVAVVDDEVIGSALVRTATATARIGPDRAVAGVGRRSATVRLTPASGVPIDLAAVQQAVTEQLDRLGASPAIRARVTLDQRGKVGA
jgi:hypothetical protein